MERIHNVNCINYAKKYNSKSGLRRHVIKCTKKHYPELKEISAVNEELANTIIAIHYELKELPKAHTLVVPSQQPITNNTTNNITNNQHIQVYLKTNCPNAINLKQFIDSISLLPSNFDVFFKKQ